MPLASKLKGGALIAIGNEGNLAMKKRKVFGPLNF